MRPNSRDIYKTICNPFGITADRLPIGWDKTNDTGLLVFDSYSQAYDYYFRNLRRLFDGKDKLKAKDIVCPYLDKEHNIPWKWMKIIRYARQRWDTEVRIYDKTKIVLLFQSLSKHLYGSEDDQKWVELYYDFFITQPLKY